MKMAFILNDLSNTGTNIATRDLIYQLKKSFNVETEIFFFDKDRQELDFFSKKKRISFFNSVDFSKYDIVHSSNFRSDVYVFLHKKFHSKKHRVQYATSVHCIIEEDLALTYGKTISKFISPFWMSIKCKNNAIFVSSESMFEHYQNQFIDKNVHIIEYGRSVDPFKDYTFPDKDLEIILKLKSKFKIIGTVGSLIKRKNYATTIDLLKIFENYAWLCLGVGEEYQDLLTLVRKNKLENRVTFLGFRDDSRPYYQYFDIFFHPSRSEGFPLVVIDAMAHKTPMLLSDLEVYSSVIKDDMAFYFTVDNRDSLISEFKKIDQDTVLTKAIAGKAYSEYKKKFSMEQYAGRHYEVFKALLKLN